ncbi:MAG: TolC family protein, partial [Vicinamibacteria bacterium]
PPSGNRLDADRAVASALERRVEMRGAEAEMAAARASVHLASLFTRPDVTLTGGYKRQSDGFDGLFLGVSLPVPLFDRRRGEFNAAEARLRAAETSRALSRRAIEVDVRRAFAAYLSTSERVALVRHQLLSGAADLLPIARVSYSEGEMTLLELLDAADAFRESQITISDLKARHWIRYYDLERAMGGVP